MDTGLLPQGNNGLFSRLHQPKDLFLVGHEAYSYDILQGLPCSLTRLHVPVTDAEPYNTAMVPSLAQFSAWQELVIAKRIHPAYCLSIFSAMSLHCHASQQQQQDVCAAWHWEPTGGAPCSHAARQELLNVWLKVESCYALLRERN
jgi:hypothetical protein